MSEQPVFQHVGVISKYGVPHVLDTLVAVSDLLSMHQIRHTFDRFSVPTELRPQIPHLAISDWTQNIDLCIVIGGDGTFLGAGRAIIERDIPMVGINLGRLGFLVDIAPMDLYRQLIQILYGQSVLEERVCLSTVIMRKGQCLRSFPAINDAVIHKRAMARMIELDMYTGGHYLCNYFADGLIISTPTGSTAYALAAGGPILEPDIEALIIVPICPHTLNHRPLVVNSHSSIRIVVNENNLADVQITIDGQEEMPLQPHDEILITQHRHKLNILHPLGYDFRKRMRSKLSWGISPQKSVNTLC